MGRLEEEDKEYNTIKECFIKFIKLNWLNLIQLEKWRKMEEKFKVKDRQLTKFEMIIKESEENKEYIGKGRMGKIYRIITELKI